MGILRQPVMRMPTQSEPGSDEQDGFGGGVNQAANYSIVDTTQVAAITNMRLVRDNEMAKRPGMKLLLASTTNARLYPISLTGATTGTILELSSLAGFPPHYRYLTWDDLTPSLTAGSTGNLLNNNYNAAPTEGVQFRDATSDVIYLANFSANNTGLMKTTGSGVPTEKIGTIPLLGRLWVYNQRLFGCKGDPYALANSTNGRTQTLYWSGLNNGDTIGDTTQGGGSATIRTFGGQNIVGGFALGASNFILHEGAVSIFRGLTFDDISIASGTVGESPNIGTPRAWQVIDQVGYIVTTNGLYLASEQGIRQYDNPEQPDPIRALIRATSGLAANNYSFSGNQWYILDNQRMNEVWFILTLSNAAGTVKTSYGFIYHKRHQRFTGAVTFPNEVSCAWVQPVSNSAFRPQMMYYNSSTGNIYGWDFADSAFQVFQDNAVNYTSSVQMRRFYTAKPSYQKAFRFLNVNMGAGAGDAPQVTGASTGASVTYTTTAGGTVADTTNMKAQEVNIIQLSGQGSYLDATVTDNGTSSTGWSVLRADVDAYILAQRAG